jgi:hypothetical protein
VSFFKQTRFSAKGVTAKDVLRLSEIRVGVNVMIGVLSSERARATPAATDESFFEFELKDGLDILYGWPIGAVDKLFSHSGRFVF